MDWTEVTRQTGREWERADGNAIVRARRTAGGDWAVTYERLTQAPEGSTYERTTAPTEDDALAVAAEFRD
ncbi:MULTISPECIES: DUF7543 family protein [Halobacterium]|uniref:Uncharacterized protein n=4 Tax=Halobacterium salinarum TaxID=2242 RepID=Q9HQE8_HALSA|nr:hypothetical protein [Halobacterium salinarum]AAG19567.1 hypothetical protein VNG_1194H [Halobacterium salinarum NRC-1]MBB6090254.1 hypothetical protein [Halobacterium salinarum]MDL0119024.1 hypothetical protein [Halobacterium salinarum]MDL0127267.1 hypothetical protein [Halobacterium salinarum]MDL0129788.1 hypothetical protein [Halobacterium salinarum]